MTFPTPATLSPDKDYELAWFTAPQASAKAIKAVFQRRGAQVLLGHALRVMLAELRRTLDVPRGLIEAARILDRSYIPTRYPDAHPSGAPHEHYTHREASRPSAMQTRSYGSVKVVYLDREAVLKAIRRGVRELARRRPEILRVILFGSMARYQPPDIPIGVDVFAYTEAELERMLAEGNMLICQALAEGTSVFERKAR